MKRRNTIIRTILFHVITLLPLFLLLYILFSIGFKIYKIRDINYGQIHTELSRYLESDKGTFEIERDVDLLRFTYTYKIKNGVYKPRQIEFTFDHSPDDYLIYVFGSSPIVSKLLTYPNDILFPAQLQKKLNEVDNKNVRVYNFGVSSFDSFEIKNLIQHTIEYQKPDMIIYYEGHMDYESAYLNVIKDHYFLLRNTLYKKLLLFFRFNQIKGLSKFTEIGDWILRSSIEPYLLNFFQASHAITINPIPFNEYNNLILDYYRKNIFDIIKYAEKDNIPVVFITPIANLEVKPFGIFPITSSDYKRGLHEKKYVKRMEYLTQAKDSEIFSGDLRAKSGLYEFYNTLASPNIYVFDLQRKLYQQEFNFGYDYFYDVGHMKPPLHTLIATLVCEYIQEKELVH
jgi:hypothetical protein